MAGAVSNQLCACGCGEYTLLCEKTSSRQGRVKGVPNKFVNGHWPQMVKKPPEHHAARTARNIKRAAEERQRRSEEDPLYQEQVREWARSRQATRRARKRGAFVEPVSRLVVLERDDGVCGICGGDVDPMCFDIDHIVPLACGGVHSYANTQPAHVSCNRSKGANHGDW